MTRKIISLALLPLFLLTACDKYLDVQPKGKRLLTTVKDYDTWLNNTTSIINAIPNELNQLDDQVDNKDIAVTLTDSFDWLYTWQQQFAVDPTVPPIIWKDLYETIYYFNTVILGIDKATGGTPQQKKSLKAEALLGRSFSYLYLVNLYGKAYNSGVTKENLAVSFVTSNDINTPTPTRSTVQEIYEHIIKDVATALSDLPTDNNQNRFRGSVAAAYSVLARTYLYMGDYPKAAQNAQLALDNGPNEILDYAAPAGIAGITPLFKRPGTIYARLLKNNFTQVTPTLSFLKTFNTKDLRLAYYYLNTNDYSFTNRGEALYISMGTTYSGAYPNCGTSVEEMRLILAEAAARAKDLPKAINELHLLRKARFNDVDYTKFESIVQEEVLQAVLKERSLELAFIGMRWFDMRRLDAEGRMPAVKRYDGQENVIATLPPHSDKYTLQIPMQVLYFNPNWVQNPWVK